jgi:hypothetical protein
MEYLIGRQQHEHAQRGVLVTAPAAAANRTARGVGSMRFRALDLNLLRVLDRLVRLDR